MFTRPAIRSSLMTAVMAAASVFLLSCGGTKLTSEPPASLDVTYQSHHVPYYFPSREELGTLKDGIYYGEVTLPSDQGRVRIEVEDNQVIDVKILALKTSRWIRMKGLHLDIYYTLPLRFIESQSPQVDAISGATGSSHVLKIAYARALYAAAGKQDPMIDYLPPEK